MSDTPNIFEQEPDHDTIGGRLSKAREASGLTVKDLAWRLGVRQSTITAWESDRSEPGSHRLTHVSGLLNVSLSWILHGVGTGPSFEDEGTTAAAAEVQLERLRHLHAQTGALIARMASDLTRMEAAR